MEIQFTVQEDCLIAALHGELDQHNASFVREELDHALSLAHYKVFILDFEGLQFMDSSGIGVVMGRFRRLAPLGCKICIISPSPHVERLLHLSGLDKLIPICSAKEEIVHG